MAREVESIRLDPVLSNAITKTAVAMGFTRTSVYRMMITEFCKGSIPPGYAPKIDVKDWKKQPPEYR
jgi:hypothetical protein